MHNVRTVWGKSYKSPFAPISGLGARLLTVRLFRELEVQQNMCYIQVLFRFKKA